MQLLQKTKQPEEPYSCVGNRQQMPRNELGWDQAATEVRIRPTVGGRVLFVGTNPVRRELVGLDVVRGCQSHTDQGQDLLVGM